MQLELQTSAAVGTRGMYVYFMDDETQTARYLAFNSAASFINKDVLQYGMSGSTVASGVERAFTGPLYVPTIDPPSRIGALLADFNDAGDVARFHLIVRESTKL